MQLRLGSHAIVIGSGIAGLCSAQVLSRYFNEVTVLERGPQPDDNQPRKEVPQGNHFHVLLKGGELALEQLFPGITQELIRDGSIRINGSQELKWFHHGVWKKRFQGELSVSLQSRPFLESHIRILLQQNPQISIRYNLKALKPIHDGKRNRIMGIQVKEGDSPQPTDFFADLVVDASGYGSVFHEWFRSHHYICLEEKVKIDLCYVSQIFRLDETKQRDWSSLLVYPSAPSEKLGGAISCIEGNRYIATLFGYDHDLASIVRQDSSTFIKLSKQLPQETIYQELQGAKPLSGINAYKAPHISRHRYEKLKEVPDRFLFIGDALCRFDPVFGQGMSIAAMSALVLDDCLQQEWKDSSRLTTHLAKRYYRKVSKMVEPVWKMILIEDFRYPHVTGKKPFGLLFLQWYTRRIFRQSSKNTDVYNAFIYVMNLLRPASTLFSPWILYKTLFKR